MIINTGRLVLIGSAEEPINLINVGVLPGDNTDGNSSETLMEFVHMTGGFLFDQTLYPIEVPGVHYCFICNRCRVCTLRRFGYIDLHFICPVF